MDSRTHSSGWKRLNSGGVTDQVGVDSKGRGLGLVAVSKSLLYGEIAAQCERVEMQMAAMKVSDNVCGEGGETVSMDTWIRRTGLPRLKRVINTLV